MPVFLGHRGFKGPLENTLPAFRRALRYAKGIELDIRLSHDGKVVLLHDGEFKAGKGIYQVKDLTLGELRKLHPLGKLVATLNQALKLRPEVLNVDVKELEAFLPALRLVERAGLLERAVFSTDRPRWLRAMARECPDCRLGFSITDSKNAVRGIFESAYSIHVPLDVAKYVGMNGMETLLNVYKRKKTEIWLWNYEMNEVILVPRFIHLADAVISDDPARLKRFIAYKRTDLEATHYVGKR